MSDIERIPSKTPPAPKAAQPSAPPAAPGPAAPGPAAAGPAGRQPAAPQQPDSQPSRRVASPQGDGPPATVREMLRRVDAAWSVFHSSVARFPAERMDEHLTEDGWTRKQMLFHIGTWHDLTTERLSKSIMSGKPEQLDQETESINARAARQAVGRTAGEILGDVEGTFNRLRRQLQRLTDQQLQAHDAWAAEIIAGNTYEHYAEHMADVYMAESEPNGRRR